MKRKLLCLIMVVGLYSYSIQSQSLTPTVISSSGGYYTSTNARLSFTVAEMTMVKTFTSTGNILTQGFQQPENVLVSVNDPEVISEDVIVYPNPTSGKLSVCYLGYNNFETIINIYNLLGQKVYSIPFSEKKGQNTINLDINYFNQGIYLLELKTKNIKAENITTYHKINLVY